MTARGFRTPLLSERKELPPMQSTADLDLAFRVLNTIRSHSIVKQRDALELRMWAAPRTRMQSLEYIANEIS